MNSPLFVNKFHRPNDIVDYLTCNPNWAMCLLDFGFQRSLPGFYSYKVKEPLTSLIVDDYYYPDNRNDFVSGVSMAFPSMSVHSEERKVERDYPEGSYFHENNMFATDPLRTCNNSESSDSSQYRQAEGNILRCRCQHFCTE